jgi:hypothetical protein
MRPEVAQDGLKGPSMVLAVDHRVKARKLSQGEPRRWYRGCFATQTGRVPVQVHLLPLDQVGQHVLDRPAAPSDARFRHLAGRQERERVLQRQALKMDLIKKR